MELAFGCMILVTSTQLLLSQKFASLMAPRGSYAIEAIPSSRYTLQLLCLSGSLWWLDLFFVPLLPVQHEYALSRVSVPCIIKPTAQAHVLSINVALLLEEFPFASL